MEQDSEILIISDESEKSTDQVLKYLLYYDAKFIKGYKLMDLSGNGNDGEIVNCEIK